MQIIENSRARLHYKRRFERSRIQARRRKPPTPIQKQRTYLQYTEAGTPPHHNHSHPSQHEPLRPPLKQFSLNKTVKSQPAKGHGSRNGLQRTSRGSFVGHELEECVTIPGISTCASIDASAAKRHRGKGLAPRNTLTQGKQEVLTGVVHGRLLHLHLHLHLHTPGQQTANR